MTLSPGGADTTLRIALARLPTVLDPTVVTSGNVTVKGNVRGAESGMYVLQGQVTLYPRGTMIGTVSGDFTFKQVAPGDSVTLVVEALEYLPKRITFVPRRDTALKILLDVDSVGLGLIRQQVQRLSSRSRAVPTSVDAVNRDDIGRLRPTSIGELIRHRLPTGAIKDRWPYKESCVFLDDQPTPFDVIQNLSPLSIERIEIYGTRGTMIRVYSKQYVASLMGVDYLPRVFC